MLRCLLLVLLCCALYGCKKNNDPVVPVKFSFPLDTMKLVRNLYIIEGTSVRSPDSNFMSASMKLKDTTALKGLF